MTTSKKPDDPVFIQYMLNLKKEGKRAEFSEAMYDVIQEHEDDPVSLIEVDNKIIAIEDLIEYFSGPEVEAYEKCAYLNKILTKLKALKAGQADDPKQSE